MKGKMKKYLSVFVAALICATSIGSFNVFAASGINGTLSFGSVSTVNFNGNNEGIANMTMGTSGGNYVTYCIDLQHNTYNQTTYTSSDSYNPPDTTYVSLSPQQQTWLNEALMFGYNGTTSYFWDSYEATQCLAWIITQTNYFGGAQESANESAIADGMLGTGTTARSDYEAIRSNMMEYDALSQEIPSFASTTSAAATQYVLNYNRADSKFELTLTDTNNILQYFDFTNSGITVSKSGNILTLSSSTPISSPLLLSANSSFQPSDVLQGAQDGLPLYWISAGSQILVSFDPSRTNKPVTAYLNVKTQDVGSIKIVKTSGDNLVEGLKFNISQGGTVIATVTTDKDGIATASNLPIGDDYTVSEINVPARYAAPASQSVTVSNDKTAEVDFDNVLNIPDNPPPTTTAKSIIVHYYFAGTHTAVHADGTAEGIIGSPLTLTAPAVDGYTAVAPGTSTITVQEGENVVVFYYTKNIAENTTPLGSNPATGDKGTAIPLIAAFASLITLAGVTVSRKIKKLRRQA
jgi:LPXTG-motif cell wall-anchored protein